MTPRAGVQILFYHRVADDPDPLAVTRRAFRAQMEALAAGGHRVLDLVEAAELLRAGEEPQGAVVLTFDDGYLDVAHEAVPVLARHGFCATVFVVPGAIEGRVRFEWYGTQPPLMSWDDIMTLDRSPTLRFEAHTLTHPNLLVLDEDAARSEILGSKRALEERLGRPVQAFCYPAGLLGEREIRLVDEAGYRVAVTCEPGINDVQASLLAMRRVQVDGRDSLLDFRAKLAGAHDRPLPLRALHRRLRYGVGGRA